MATLYCALCAGCMQQAGCAGSRRSAVERHVEAALCMRLHVWPLQGHAAAVAAASREKWCSWHMQWKVCISKLVQIACAVACVCAGCQGVSVHQPHKRHSSGEGRWKCSAFAASISTSTRPPFQLQLHLPSSRRISSCVCSRVRSQLLCALSSTRPVTRPCTHGCFQPACATYSHLQ
jgi:hypothetical protein